MMCHLAPYWKLCSLRNCWPLVMQPTNLSGVPFGNERLVRVFLTDQQFEIGKKHRLVLYFINLSTNSSTLRPLWCGARRTIHMVTSTYQINLYPASAVGSCLMIYKLEKLSDQRFQTKLLPVFPLWKFRAETPPPNEFGFPNCVTPYALEFQS